MQITITARHFNLTKAIRDTIEDSTEKLSRYFDQIVTVHITLSLENARNIVDMSLHASKFNLQAQAEAMDMYLAINEAIDNMEAQIKKLKDKVTDHKKKRLKEDPRFVYDNLYEHNASEKTQRVIKTKRFVADTMTVDEAVDQIEKAEDNFLIFRNVETDSINVLVKQDKNHFKVLEP
ncbi:MAG: ribosome-associated translation inhibitor RaiA [Candidatus Cloacimonetes bacterium]|nr:ribosome-associated translation inhibitor RaiA [Candidatus Cloacimonadota bacterium]